MPKPRRYHRYINSSRWQRKREEKFAQVGRKCERCRATERLDVHHLSYAHFGDEPLDELRVLCRRCHRRAHGKKDYGRHRPVKVIRVDPAILRTCGTETAILYAQKSVPCFPPARADSM